MIASFLLALREGVEAALIVGIVLSILRKLDRRDLVPALVTGSVTAGVLSLLIAIGLRLAGASLTSPAEEIFEGFSMLLAAGVLTWMIFWMQRQSRTIRSELENQVRKNLSHGKRPIFWLAFFAIFREGVELALFLLAAGLATNPFQSWSGAALGLAAAAVIGILLFTSTRRLNIRSFFRVTNVLLLLFAAGLFAHGIHEFNEIGWIPPVIEHVYDLNPILPETSFAGSLLKAMFGYNGNPSLTELIAYFAYFGGISAFLWAAQRRSQSPLPA